MEEYICVGSKKRGVGAGQSVGTHYLLMSILVVVWLQEKSTPIGADRWKRRLNLARQEQVSADDANIRNYVLGKPLQGVLLHQRIFWILRPEICDGFIRPDVISSRQQCKKVVGVQAQRGDA